MYEVKKEIIETVELNSSDEEELYDDDEIDELCDDFDRISEMDLEKFAETSPVLSSDDDTATDSEAANEKDKTWKMKLSQGKSSRSVKEESSKWQSKFKEDLDEIPAEVIPESHAELEQEKAEVSDDSIAQLSQVCSSLCIRVLTDNSL